MVKEKLTRQARKTRAAERKLEIWDEIDKEYKRLEEIWRDKRIKFKDLLINLNHFIETWIKKNPGEAHLIRQEAVKFSKIITDTWNSLVGEIEKVKEKEKEL